MAVLVWVCDLLLASLAPMYEISCMLLGLVLELTLVIAAKNTWKERSMMSDSVTEMSRARKNHIAQS